MTAKQKPAQPSRSKMLGKHKISLFLAEHYGRIEIDGKLLVEIPNDAEEPFMVNMFNSLDGVIFRRIMRQIRECESDIWDILLSAMVRKYPDMKDEAWWAALSTPKD